jgi:hypothetical protein
VLEGVMVAARGAALAAGRGRISHWLLTKERR